MIQVVASESDILACQFQSWYPSFLKITSKSKLIEAPEAFLNYLNQDGIYDFSDENEDQSSDGESLRSQSDLNQKNLKIELANTIREIKSGIAELGGPVFCKFNWTAPIDAVWMNAGTTKCFTCNDVFLLLKSSDRVAFDMDHTFDHCPASTCSGVNERDDIVTSSSDTTTVPRNKLPPQSFIILRKWASINPALEFRLFVIDGRLVKSCQRDCTTFHPFLAVDRSKWLHLLTTFYESKILGKFSLRKFTLDVYILSSDSVRLVDFNPFGEPTSALLFEWTDFWPYLSGSPLDHSTSASASLSDVLELRLVESEREVLPSTKGIARAPIDVSQAPDFHNFMQVCKDQQQDDESFDDEDS